MASSLIFIGINGRVLALDKSSGQEVWRAKLAGSDIVNLAVEDGKIYATCHGEVFCLSPTSGEVLWRNPLKGLGFGLVSIGLPGGQNAILAAKRSQDDAAAASAAATTVFIS